MTTTATASGQLLPGSDATDFTKISFIVAAALANMQTVSLCEVVNVNTGAQTVDVQVLINLVTASGQSIPHGVIYGRPYFRLQGGTNGIICDPAPGDIGVIVFASRDISAVVSTKGTANPGSQRQFDWADGVYIGGVLNATPTQYIQFGSGAITVESPSVTASGNMSITGTLHGGVVTAGNGASGTFTTNDGKTVTVVDGIITSIT